MIETVNGRMNGRVPDFDADVRRSDTPEMRAAWEIQFRKFYPNYVTTFWTSGDCYAQQRGVDALVYLNNDVTQRIEIKNDWYEPVNFALEWGSLNPPDLKPGEKRYPGWIEKPLACDYLCYHFVKHGMFYFLPWQPLRNAWLRNRDDWERTYLYRPVPVSQGSPLISENVMVPIKVVWQAIHREQHLKGDIVVKGD